MNKRQLLYLTLTLVLFGTTAAWSHGMRAVTDENGRKIYVNDESTASADGAAADSATASQEPRLVYWSNTQRRWKPVPRAKTAAFKAAKSAANEVSAFMERSERRAAEQGDSNGQGWEQRIVNAASIEAAINEAAARHNVDPNLVRAVIKVESNFNPQAISPKGAMGLMQLMPGTARTLKVARPFDPNENIDAGVRHLKQLMESFGGDLNLSLAAYNAGSNAVRRNKGIPPYRETQNYVRQITQLYWNGDPARLSGGPIRNPIRVSRDDEGHFVFSNMD
jgi:soluble lytic murein transglycosylase-like protein